MGIRNEQVRGSRRRAAPDFRRKIIILIARRLPRAAATPEDFSGPLPAMHAQRLPLLRGFVPHRAGRLKSLHMDRCPFVNLSSSKASHWGEVITAEDMAAIAWVKPKVVVDIAFTEWTADGSLRHAAFVALRDDKQPHRVHKET